MSADTRRLPGQGTSASRVVVNGNACELGGPPSRNLLALLRADLGLAGMKPGCGEGECGACTVLVDGAPVLLRGPAQQAPEPAPRNVPPLAQLGAVAASPIPNRWFSRRQIRFAILRTRLPVI